MHTSVRLAARGGISGLFDRPCVRVCVCTQGRADRRLLIKRAIAAKVCLVINIGLSISGEELPLSVFTAEINMSRVARLRLPLIVSALYFQPHQVFVFLKHPSLNSSSGSQAAIKKELIMKYSPHPCFCLTIFGW